MACEGEKSTGRLAIRSVVGTVFTDPIVSIILPLLISLSPSSKNLTSPTNYILQEFDCHVGSLRRCECGDVRRFDRFP